MPVSRQTRFQYLRIGSAALTRSQLSLPVAALPTKPPITLRQTRCWP